MRPGIEMYRFDETDEAYFVLKVKKGAKVIFAQLFSNSIALEDYQLEVYVECDIDSTEFEPMLMMCSRAQSWDEFGFYRNNVYSFNQVNVSYVPTIVYNAENVKHLFNVGIKAVSLIDAADPNQTAELEATYGITIPPTLYDDSTWYTSS